MRTVYVEVSNTLALGFTTGIQRVTREILRSVAAVKSPYQFLPIVYCPYCTTWRRLTEQETTLLHTGAQAPIQRQETASGPGARLRQKTVAFLRTMPLVRSLRDRYKQFTHSPCPSSLHLHGFEPGSIFLDMESSWFSPYSRMDLLPKLRQALLQVVVIHYDIIPFLFPQYVHPETEKHFRRHFQAHVEHESIFLCISNNSRRDLLQYLATHHARSTVQTDCITLGANYRVIDAPLERS